MRLLLQPDVLETIGMCAVWFAAGLVAGYAAFKPFKPFNRSKTRSAQIVRSNGGHHV